MSDRLSLAPALAGSLLAIAMGCYLSRAKWCGPLSLAAGRADDDDDDDGGADASRATPPLRATSGSGRRVVFRAELCEELPIARLHDLPVWVREQVYWQAHEYAQIRENQRRLIETVLRAARRAPDGETPPPIPGESRRGLGLVCEPGTNSGRAARVRSARRAVVEAQRDGYSPGQLAALAAELGRWATRNARDVGLRDAEAVGDFDCESFKIACAAGDVIVDMPKVVSTSPPVAHAIRSDAGSSAASSEKSDGLGLASMVKSDSLSDLSAVAHAAPTKAAQPRAESLATMLRTDSLGDLKAVDGP